MSFKKKQAINNDRLFKHFYEFVFPHCIINLRYRTTSLPGLPSELLPELLPEPLPSCQP
jgi:hypothetical protein